MGFRKLLVWALVFGTTSAGYILINSDYEETVPVILAYIDPQGYHALIDSSEKAFNDRLVALKSELKDSK
jgi:hypothetical protein